MAGQILNIVKIKRITAHFGIFESHEKFDLHGSYTFSQNITKFGKSGFLKRKKDFVT